MEQITRNTNEMTWTTEVFPGDVLVKTLREESGNGAKTILVKIPEGGEIVPHSHTESVQHLILEGTYESEGEAFPEGTFRILPSHGDVPTIFSSTGAVVLMIYDPGNGQG